jgi:hypothetical protein
LPSSHKLEVDNSNGDECHYNIRNVEDDEAEDFFIANHNGSLMSCIDGLEPQRIAYKDAMDKFLAFSAN